jgi:hypothetical protein
MAFITVIWVVVQEGDIDGVQLDAPGMGWHLV